jgi:hypothetical protein
MRTLKTNPVARALMKVSYLLLAAIVLSSQTQLATSATDNKHLSAFRSENDLQAYLQKLKLQDEKRNKSNYTKEVGAIMPASSPPTAVSDSSAEKSSSAKSDSDAITNVQTQGVDEGGIVKKLGDYLIVLRRGRLFSIKASSNDLRTVSTINAFGPGISPQGAWYDEMLISGQTIIVVGYSYARGGTEIGLFRISENGQLSYRNTYHLRSNDYFSSRNFASRLIGNQLIFYSPMRLNLYGDLNDSMPAVRPWQKNLAAFQRILPATRIFQSGQELNAYDLTLHTVSTCTISEQSDLDCRATAVLGPSSRVFYVSGEAVYVWVGHSNSYQQAHKQNNSMLLRMPLNGQSPQALRVSGNPIDQLSFLERDGYLNVLVGSEAGGDGMWRAEGNAGSLALLRVPLQAFGNSRASSQTRNYRPIPATFDWSLQNRFVGDWLLVGSSYQHNATASVFAVPYARAGQTVPLNLRHSTERIEAMGNDAVVIGRAGNDLIFSSIRLDNQATPVSGYIQRNASQSESRTHGFFYQPENTLTGLLGLPIIGGDYQRPTAAVKYLRNKNLQLSDMGMLTASSNSNLNDNCQASCVDWYGNARPIFIGKRVYALMGYELVEGRISGSDIVEQRRLNYAPQLPRNR